MPIEEKVLIIKCPILNGYYKAGLATRVQQVMDAVITEEQIMCPNYHKHKKKCEMPFSGSESVFEDCLYENFLAVKKK